MSILSVVGIYFLATGIRTVVAVKKTLVLEEKILPVKNEIEEIKIEANDKGTDVDKKAKAPKIKSNFFILCRCVMKCVAKVRLFIDVTKILPLIFLKGKFFLFSARQTGKSTLPTRYS